MATTQPVLLWVHGLFGHPDEFAEVVQQFDALGYTSHQLTLPGHGSQPTVPFGQLTPEVLCTRLQQQIQELTASQPAKPYLLIGHSLGAILSLLTATTQPRGLLGVVALSGALEDAFVINQQRLLRCSPALLMNALRFVPDYWHGHPRPELPPGVFRQLRANGYALLAQLQQRLEGITCPVLLAHSPYDLSIPYEEMHKLYCGLQATPAPVYSITLEECGHQIFPLSRAQDEVVALLLRFLASIES